VYYGTTIEQGRCKEEAGSLRCGFDLEAQYKQSKCVITLAGL